MCIRHILLTGHQARKDGAHVCFAPDPIVEHCLCIFWSVGFRLGQAFFRAIDIAILIACVGRQRRNKAMRQWSGQMAHPCRALACAQRCWLLAAFAKGAHPSVPDLQRSQGCPTRSLQEHFIFLASSLPNFLSSYTSTFYNSKFFIILCFHISNLYIIACFICLIFFHVHVCNLEHQGARRLFYHKLALQCHNEHDDQH